MSFWYKNSGPWWESANSKPNDGISLEEEITDPLSLYNFYKKMIHLRNSHLALSLGTYQNAPNNNQSVLSFYRLSEKQKVLVIVNLSSEAQRYQMDQEIKNAKNLLELSAAFNQQLMLKPFEFQVWEVKK